MLDRIKMRLIEEFLQDLRYGRRLLAKNPGVTSDSDRDARSGHWRQHSDLQRRQCLSSAPAALRRSGPPGDGGFTASRSIDRSVVRRL